MPETLREPPLTQEELAECGLLSAAFFYECERLRATKALAADIAAAVFRHDTHNRLRRRLDAVEEALATPPTGQSGVEALREALRAHHEWHFEVGDAEAYSDSALYEKTMAALSASPSPSERTAPVAGPVDPTDWDAPEPITLAKVREWRAEADKLLMETMEGPYSVIVALCDLIISAPPASTVAQIVAWQDMASAPKNGDRVFAYGVHTDPVAAGAERGVQPGDHWWGIIAWDEWREPHQWVFSKDGKPVWSEPMAYRTDVFSVPLDEAGEWQGTPVPKETKA